MDRRPKKPYRPPRVRSEKVLPPHMFATDFAPTDTAEEPPQPKP